MNVNWAEKLGITAPDAELSKDLGPLISRNLKPVFQVPPPVGNQRLRPTLNESWEKAVKKGLRIVKETKDWVEVRIPIEIRSLIPDMPTRVRLKNYEFKSEIVNETPYFWNPLPTPPGYVRKIKGYLKTWRGADGPVERNKMTNLPTIRQNRSGRMRINVRFENMSLADYNYPGVFPSSIRLDMEGKKRILRDGLFYVVITNDNNISIKNKYFESGRGIEVSLRVNPSEHVGVISATIISKKQPRPEPRAPSTRPRKRRRNV